MKFSSKRKTSVLIFAAVCLAAILSLIAVQVAGIIAAAREMSITTGGSGNFYGSGNAEVLVFPTGENYENGNPIYYSMFAFSKNGDGMEYRNNLAYEWYELASPSLATADDGEDKEEEKPTVHAMGKKGNLTLGVGFESFAFDRFVITFQSQQFSQTEDEVTTNYIVFMPADNGKVKVLITDDEESFKDKTASSEWASPLPELDASDSKEIVIKLSKQAGGKYAVTLNGTECGEFVNVGGNYSRYVSSSRTNPVLPLSFKAEWNEGNEPAENTLPALMVLYEINNQRFEIPSPSDYTGSNTALNKYKVGGLVNDTTPPVLCMDEEITYFKATGKLDIDYTVIDVLQSGPSAKAYYYIPTYAQVKAGGDLDAAKLFTEIDTDVNLNTVEGAGENSSYNPYKDTENLTNLNSLNAFTDKKVTSLVKIYFTLTDTTYSGGTSTTVYLDWYVGDDFKVKSTGDCEYTEEEQKKTHDNYYIAVMKDDVGARYTFNETNADGKTFAEIFQSKINEIAFDENGHSKLSAGSDNKIYLPSVEDLIKDDFTAYTDLKFTVYYRDPDGSTSSSSSLSYNTLSFDIKKKGNYVFTVYATDGAGNNMSYIDDDGELQTISSSDIWDKDFRDRLPWFNFVTTNTGVEIEEAEAQSTAYVGTKYNVQSFTLKNAIDYKTEYRLYEFDRAAYANATGNSLTYEEFMEQLKTLLETPETRVYFREILPSSELENDAENSEKFSKYEWDASARTFIPQDPNAFYAVKLTVTDDNEAQTKAYMAINASAKAKTIKGENDWLKNNVASVILLCVAGVSLVGIVLLVVIKPKKTDVDEVSPKKAKKAKTNKDLD